MAFSPDLILFESREGMAARLAELTAAHLSAAIAERGRATFAASGGSTPEPLYRALAARPLEWSKIDIGLVDERWVAPDHPRSNEAFVRRAFAAAVQARVVGMHNDAKNPCDGVTEVAAAYRALGDPVDIVILGLGPDGHTASWFPHAEGLDAALDGEQRLCAIRARKSAVTGDEIDRMTLSLSAIRNARLIVLMITGDDKKATFEAARRPGPVADMPVRAIFNARPDLWACWAP